MMKNLKVIKKNTKMIKSQAGSTLIWVLIMMLVLGILITTGLVVAQSYSNRSLNQHVEKQSYYTALSMTKSIAEWLSGASDGEPSKYAKQLDYINDIKSKENRSVTFDSTVDSKLGSCQTTIHVDEDNNIKISSTAKYSDQTSTVNATLKKSTETVGSGEGESPGLEKNLLITPPDSNPEPMTNPSDSGDSSLRKLHANLNKDRINAIVNILSKGSNPSWQAQYYELHTNGGNSADNSFIKLLNGDFAEPDNSGKMQDRHMTIYSKSDSMKGDYDNLIIYTQETKSETELQPPRKNIAILPTIEEKKNNNNQYKKDIAFRRIINSTYRNLRVQINDTGNAINNEKSKLILTRGLQLTGKSSIYTRRDTLLGCDYVGSSGSIPSENANESTFNHDGNTSIPKFVLEGDLQVADNTTTLYDGYANANNNKFKGNIVIKKSTTDEARLVVGQYIDISDGTIYIGDGGYLKLTKWNSNISNDIYVYPGGTVDIEVSPLFNCNIYAYSGLGSNGKPATIKASGQNRFSGKMVTLDDRQVTGGIFLEGSTDNQGPRLELGSGNGHFGQGCIHASEGAYVDPDINGQNFCDSVVNGVPGWQAKRTCNCSIKLPEGGGVTQEVTSWQILGYSES